MSTMDRNRATGAICFHGAIAARVALLCLTTAACTSVVILDDTGASSGSTASSMTAGSGGPSGATGAGGAPTSTGTASQGPGGASGGPSGTGGSTTIDDCTAPHIAVLAEKQGIIKGIALDATHVYWTSDDFQNNLRRVLSMPKAGGAITVLATMEPKASPGDIAVDAARVYWSEGSAATISGVPVGKVTIRSVAKSGDPSTLKQLAVTVDGGAAGLALDNDRVYWAESSNSVYSVAKNGNEAPTMLVPPDPAMNSTWARGVLVDDAALYWLALDTNLMTMPKGGGSPVVLASQPGNAYRLVMDESHYWFGNDAQNLDPSPLVTGVKSGGPLTTFLDDVGGVTGIALNASCLYWKTSVSVNRIRAAPKAGGSPVDIAPVEAMSEILVADASGVYWVDSHIYEVGRDNLMRASK